MVGVIVVIVGVNVAVIVIAIIILNDHNAIIITYNNVTWKYSYIATSNRYININGLM